MPGVVRLQEDHADSEPELEHGAAADADEEEEPQQKRRSASDFALALSKSPQAKKGVKVAGETDGRRMSRIKTTMAVSVNKEDVSKAEPKVSGRSMARARTVIVTAGSKEPPEDLRDSWAASNAAAQACLMQHTLFKGCSEDFTEKVAQRARRLNLAPFKELKLEPAGPCHIVESGAVQVQVGGGSLETLGPGTSLNEVGMLALNGEAEEIRETNMMTDSSTPYKMMSLGLARAADTSADANIGDENACIHNLCPCAIPEVQRMAKESWSEGWLPVHVQGAEAGSIPLTGGEPEDFIEGGAQIVSITRQMIQDAGKGDSANLQIFYENSKRLSSKWRSILRHGKVCFPRVPPGIAWRMAEFSERRIVEVGKNLVEEADGTEDCEAIYIIEAGTATVEKLVGGAVAREQQVGVLGLGAVIGDISFVGAGIPRVANCKARGSIEALKIPARPFMDLLRRFPGMLDGIRSHLENHGLDLVDRLEPTVYTLSSLFLFADCDAMLLNDLAKKSVRRVVFAGQAIKEQGSTDATFYALEFGLCAVETKSDGFINSVRIGNCFGDRTLIGASKTANATVRVWTPFAIVLELEQEVFNSSLKRFPAEQKHFQKMKHTPEVRTLGRMMMHIEVFEKSCKAFVEEIARFVQPRCYLPRMTMCVQGAKDACQMFILKSGHVNVEKGKTKCGELATGASFGELAMLGAVRRRTVTIRAMVFCFTMEIPRENFVAACDKFPDERSHYEAEGMKKMDDETKVYWPSLGGCPERLQYLLSLYAERKICQAQATWMNQTRLQRSAMLIVSGSVNVSDSSGRSECLGAGECLNEQALLGLSLSDKLEASIIPETACEVQIITMDVWDKIVREFDNALARVRPGIVGSMVAKATRRWERIFGYDDVLQRSALFQGCSEAFLVCVANKLEDLVLDKGDVIFAKDSPNQSLYLMLCGSATCEDGHTISLIEEGAVFGEAGLVGLCALHAFSLKAESLCIMQYLRQADFLECLKQFPVENHRFTKLRAEAEKVVDLFHHSTLQSKSHDASVPAQVQHLTLKQKVHSTPSFRHCDPGFFKNLTSNLRDEFFAPNQPVVTIKEKCTYGHTPMYVILAGQCHVRSPWGVILGVLSAGEIFGEGGALGLVEERSCEVVAWPEGLAQCARIDGAAVKEALSHAHGEAESLKELFQRRCTVNREYLDRREIWVWQTAVPALAGSSLFGGCSEEFLHVLATPLLECNVKKGQRIAITGEAGESMQLLLSGEAMLESKDGTDIAPLGEGASYGEINLLGLFHSRMATLRATSDCRVLEVTRAALRQVLDLPENANMHRAFEILVTSRHEQIAKGLPLSALPLNVPHDNLFVRAVALLAERMDVEAGQEWDARPDSDACGPHTCVLAKGRAAVETASGRLVVTLVPGSIAADGLIHEHGAHYRAERHCEVYRFRQMDLDLARMSIPSGLEAFYKVRVLEKEARKNLEARLNQTRGCTEGLAPHPADVNIMAWKYRRTEAIDYANHLKSFSIDWDKLPRMMQEGRKAKSRGSTRQGRAVSRGRLSRPHTEAGGMRHASSTPALVRVSAPGQSVASQETSSRVSTAPRATTSESRLPRI